jgi:predicted nucleotidyltransferase
MPFFNRTHERILRKFLFRRVDFVLMGGHAAVFYGVRRTTSDIDILVRPTLENGHRIIEAFQDLKLEIDSIQPSDFTTEQLFTFGAEPNAVDILNFSKGVSLESIFENAIHKKIDGFAIKIIDIRDLVRNKESLNRKGEKNLTDQQDILALRRILKSR